MLFPLFKLSKAGASDISLMKLVSFDIFDTCLIRKCGAPENVFDVLSLRAFTGEIEECERQEFVAARRMAELKIAEENPHYTLQGIWDAFAWEHPMLKSKAELYYLEQETERAMLVPVLKIRDQVNQLRNKGHRIIFISDMYLPFSFLCNVMREHGFMQDGDSLYVSCECDAEKQTGELYKYVRDKERLSSFRKWHHHGDNLQSDYAVPRQLGIKCTLVNHAYTPYQQQWVNNTYPLTYKSPGILAGIGRAMHYSMISTSHLVFVTDIIAPFYCSLVYRIMQDAVRRGIQRLYFCARDAYIMYKIALQYSSFFPNIDSRFLYISRKALYEGDDVAKMLYYEQVGLATKVDSVGIVDIRSSGKTLIYLNQLLSSKGFKTVHGYYYELFCGVASGMSTYSPSDYYAELSDNYAPRRGVAIGSRFHIFENYFPLNVIPKTIDYTIRDGIAQPVSGSDDIDGTEEKEKVFIKEKEVLASQHEALIKEFTAMYITCGLHVHSDEVFRMANDTLFRFLDKPCKYYLPALEGLYGKKNGETQFIPYVKKESWFSILLTRGEDTIWEKATIEYSNLGWLYECLRKIKYNV